MFEDSNQSFMDLDNSFLLQSDSDPQESLYPEKYPEDIFEFNRHENLQTVYLNQSYSGSYKNTKSYISNNYHGAKQTTLSPNSVYQNKKYQPIIDNGITYTYEKDSVQYKKIRKSV